MKTLVIIDKNSHKVHIYKVHKNCEINDKYVEEMGFNLSNCAWICGTDIDIFKHMGILM